MGAAIILTLSMYTLRIPILLKIPMPKVSVVIPVYNAEKYIERCVRSLFGQTLDNLEYIFVDDCSPDHSIEVMERVLAEFPFRQSQVKVVRHKVNQGVAAARQHGVDAATGEYVIHCDPDDWIEINMYSEMVNKAIKEHADVAICRFFINYSDYQKEINETYESNPKTFLMQIIKGTIHNSLCNKLIRRTILLEVSPLFTPGLNMWEDVSMLARVISKATSVVIINYALYHYNQSNDKSYTHKWKHQYSENIDKAIALNLDFFRNSEISPNALVHRGLYCILANEDDLNRIRYLEKYKKAGLTKNVDYSIFSSYGRLLARCLFNNHFTLANYILKTRNVLKKLSR